MNNLYIAIDILELFNLSCYDKTPTTPSPNSQLPQYIVFYCY